MKLFQFHICHYCFFRVVIKTHEKQTWRRETSLFFLKHTLAVHFVKKLFQCDICDFLFSSSFLKHMKNIKEERNLIVFPKTHTCSSFCKEAVPMWYLWLAVFNLLFKTHEKQAWRRETSLFFSQHTLAVHFVKKLFHCQIFDDCCL